MGSGGGGVKPWIVGVRNVNMSRLKLIETEKIRSLRLRKFIDIISKDPKDPNIFPAHGRVPLHLKLKVPRCAPCVAPTRNYSSEQRKMIQAEVDKLTKNEAIRESNSS